jgi:hypothetical protein
MQHVQVKGAPYVQEVMFEDQPDPEPVTIF